MLGPPAGEKPEIHLQRQVEIAISSAFTIDYDDFRSAPPLNVDLRHIAPVCAQIKEIASDDEVFHRLEFSLSGSKAQGLRLNHSSQRPQAKFSRWASVAPACQSRTADYVSLIHWCPSLKVFERSPQATAPSRATRRARSI